MLPEQKYSIYQLSELSYRWQQVANDCAKQLVDYGTGELYTSSEVHLVTRIEKNPGITVTKIAEDTLRTKSAVSQMVSKLEQKGLVVRAKNPQNTKQQLLYVTPKGLELSKCHQTYDDTYEHINDLIQIFGMETMEKFIDIIEYSTVYMLNRLHKHSAE